MLYESLKFTTKNQVNGMSAIITVTQSNKRGLGLAGWQVQTCCGLLSAVKFKGADDTVDIQKKRKLD